MSDLAGSKAGCSGWSARGGLSIGAHRSRQSSMSKLQNAVNFSSGTRVLHKTSIKECEEDADWATSLNGVHIQTCLRCPVEPREHVFRFCWVAIFEHGRSQVHNKNNIYICPRTIRFVGINSGAPHDMLMLLGLSRLSETNSCPPR